MQADIDNLEALQLLNTGLSMEACSAIIKSIVHKRHLKNLDLSGNSLKIRERELNDEQPHPLIEVFYTTPLLESLSLASCRLLTLAGKNVVPWENPRETAEALLEFSTSLR